jgi:hypothetical protein
MKFRGSLRNTLKTYSKKLENLEEIHKILEIYDLPKLNQKYINNLDYYAMSNDGEAVTVSQQRRAQGQMGSLPNSTRPLKN